MGGETPPGSPSLHQTEQTTNLLSVLEWPVATFKELSALCCIAASLVQESGEALVTPHTTALQAYTATVLGNNEHTAN